MPPAQQYVDHGYMSGANLQASLDQSIDLRGFIRDGNRIATVPNTGSYTDSIGVKGGNDRYSYKVCESLTENCSNEVTVRFGGPPL